MSTVDGCAGPLGGVADNLFKIDAEQRVRSQQAAVAAEEVTTPFRMLRRSMSDMGRGDRRMGVQDGPTANVKRALTNAACKADAGKFGDIGWHTFRHIYHSWLDETGAPMRVRQELMRHASTQTKVNVQGQAMPESQRAANGKVVTMVLQPLRASA